MKRSFKNDDRRKKKKVMTLVEEMRSLSVDPIVFGELSDADGDGDGRQTQDGDVMLMPSARVL